MEIRRTKSTTMIVLFLIYSLSTLGTHATSVEPKGKLMKNECTLYLAPSLKESDELNFILGMFAGVDLPENSTIGIPDLAIPVIDMDLHNGQPKGYVKRDYFQKQADFFWKSSTVGATYEIHSYPKESDEVKFGGSGLLMAIPGIGSLTADHPSVSNAVWNADAVLRRTAADASADVDADADVDVNKDVNKDTDIDRHDTDTNDNNDNNDRKSHPGRGAYTHYYNVTLQTTKTIRTGMQIFQDVGTQWEYTKNSKTLKPIDYEDVDRLLRKIDTFLDKHAHKDAATAQQRNELYNFFVKDILRIVGTKGWNDDDDRNQNKDFKRAILKLFPDSPDDIPRVLEQGGTFEANHPENIRDIAWLRSNGQCLDGIYSDRSTLQYAGRGAFASRDIANGGLVAPAPLLVIDRKQWLNMYGTKLQTGRHHDRKYAMRANGRKVLHRQMLLNYCFGHPQSSLLLFSYGMGVNFINHGATHDRANAKIVWTEQPYNNPALRNLPLKEFINMDNAHLRLGFDIVATRHIQAHEEVFIDYGTEWAQAWQSHVDSNKYPHFWHTTALDINTAMSAAAGNDTIHTLSERQGMGRNNQQDPYDDSFLMTACHYASENIHEDDDTPRTIDDFAVFQFPQDEDLTGMLHNLHGCTVLERHTRLLDGGVEGFSYTVFFIPENEEGNIIVKGVPREAIVFVDKPYESDLHASKTFRHPIGIPDSLFPAAWRDLK